MKVFQPSGATVGAARTLEEEARIPQGAPTVDVDEATNPDVLNGLMSAPREFSIVGGVLNRNGRPVVINPPGNSDERFLRTFIAKDPALVLPAENARALQIVVKRLFSRDL